MGGKIIQEKLIGKYVTLREVREDDADFILKLRCDEKKSKFLHKTEFDIENQKKYIKSYFEKSDEWYFISEDKDGNPIGTYRIYDLRQNSFCIGSWLMVEGTTAEQSFETDYLVRMYGFDVLGFNKIHFDVRKGNKKVLRYHKSLGAIQTGDTELDILFEISKYDYLNNSKLMVKSLGL
ncbi:GNAT family N-acetyltransferase [Treponema sp.]|uniref:GNAT family N-acetyltransferase n=1 Tax=Treponema sp. TaxID=166 RepID=UPI00298E5A37|nr:GNAT family N-acetyltransferase [Treponema sp.]MCQ2241395.1 GNAT family N-acetyltransferase [Treponema sp.]